MKSKLITWCAFGLLLFGYQEGKALSVTLISTSVCEGVAETPILASQLNGIASISIKLNYDTTQVAYLGVRNVHPGIANALITSNGGKFIIAWFSLNPAQIGSDTMMVVRWTAANYGSSLLEFDTQTIGNCEITNLQGTPLGVQYVNGSVAITGPRAPQPLNPLRLYNLNQPSYLFLYRRQPCMQSASLQIARDSLFTQGLFLVTMPDTTYAFPIPSLMPSSGDSVLWWRMGGVYQSDTSWSASGRLSFSIFLSLETLQPQPMRIYPNPFQETFYIEHPSFETAPLVQLQIYDVKGRLLWKTELQGDAQRLFVKLPENIQNQQLFVLWSNKIASGSAVTIKSAH
jgi:hypothetical protein